MAKGPIVTPEVEMLIRDVHKEHPKWKAPRVRTEVEFILRSNNRGLPKGWPSLSKVQKVLATVRKKEEEISEEDKLWHIGTLKKYPVPPEALAFVIAFWINRSEEGRAFTIREAQWVARLYALFDEPAYEQVDLFVLRYAWTEETCEYITYPHDLLPFDQTLDLLLAQEVLDEKVNEETKSNIEELYKKVDAITRRGIDALLKDMPYEL